MYTGLFLPLIGGFLLSLGGSLLGLVVGCPFIIILSLNKYTMGIKYETLSSVTGL